MNEHISKNLIQSVVEINHFGSSVFRKIAITEASYRLKNFRISENVENEFYRRITIFVEYRWNNL